MTVTVRSLPVPAITMLASGTSVVFDETPVTTNAFANVSASETVKSIAGVDVLATTVCWTMSEIVGRALVANTVNTKESVAVRPPSSVTVTVILEDPV